MCSYITNLYLTLIKPYFQWFLAASPSHYRCTHCFGQLITGRPRNSHGIVSAHCTPSASFGFQLIFPGLYVSLQDLLVRAIKFIVHFQGDLVFLDRLANLKVLTMSQRLSLQIDQFPSFELSVLGIAQDLACLFFQGLCLNLLQATGIRAATQVLGCACDSPQ